MKGLLVLALLAATLRETAAEELTVTAGWDEQTFVGARDRIEVKLGRALTAEDGRIGLVLDSTDLTGLFRPLETSLVYGPNSVALPAGEHELVVSRVSASGEWTEIARLKLKVRTRGGFDTASVVPVADVANKGQVAEGHHPDEPAPPRTTFQDFTAQVGFRTEHVRDDFAIRTNVNVTGVSFRDEALRFGTMGLEAPRIDLAAWGVEVQKGWAKLTAGQVAIGSQRHLASAFASRGLVLTLSPGRVFSLQAGVMNGTAIVGWDNVLGVATEEHQVRTATLGVELVPSRPGGFRLELSALDGSVQPLSGFTQGAIQSAEKSRGGAVRLLFAEPSQSLVVDAGFSRTRFRAAKDPQLEEDLEVLEIPDETRNAQYADVTVTPFPTITVSPTTQASFSVALHHERVEPQYRSVAAFTQADRMQNGVDVNGTLGPLALQGSFQWLEDDLDELPNILKTKTNRSAGNLALSLPVLFGREGTPAAWAPSITLNGERIHQYGADVPENADAVLSFIPDLVGTVAGAQVAWQLSTVQLGYRFGWSFQDNRQPDREQADLRTTTNGITASVAPLASIGLQVEVAFERADNLETGRSDRTRRLSGSLSWQPFSRTSLSVSASTTLGRDRERTSENDSEELAAEAAQGFALGKLLPLSGEGVRGRVFVRYASRRASSFDRTFGFDSFASGWQWNTGVSLSLF